MVQVVNRGWPEIECHFCENIFAQIFNHEIFRLKFEFCFQEKLISQPYFVIQTVFLQLRLLNFIFLSDSFIFTENFLRKIALKGQSRFFA